MNKVLPNRKVLLAWTVWYNNKIQEVRRWLLSDKSSDYVEI